MTFSQQQDVKVSPLISIDPNDSVEGVKSRLTDQSPIYNRARAGPLILTDIAGIERLLTLIIRRLQNHPTSALSKAICQRVESTRLVTRFWELRLFLAFSALEFLAREFVPRKQQEEGPIPGKMAQLLSAHGFGVKMTHTRVWANARNRAFHIGVKKSALKKSKKKKIDTIHLLRALETIHADVCLKQLGYEDETINWNRWKDAMPFGGASGGCIGLDNLPDLKIQGFVGFKSIKELWLDCRAVPEAAGVYMIVSAVRNRPPEFLATGSGGRFKGRDPNVSESQLAQKWIKNRVVLYIGKAGSPGQKTNLLKRVKAYLAFGRGKSVSHVGGRYIWQLKWAEELLVCWKRTPFESPREVEKALLQRFSQKFGGLPFANGTL
jgi:hypothetical protein